MTDTQSAQGMSDAKDLCLALINTETANQFTIRVEEVFDELARISLDTRVPEVIQKQFNDSKDMTLYSCFSSSYQPIAVNNITSTLVAALSLRLGKHGHRLKWLIDRAVNTGLIKDTRYGESGETELAELVNKLCNMRVLDTGSSYSVKIENLRFCAYLINQLYS